jgi:hypothetical protein
MKIALFILVVCINYNCSGQTDSKLLTDELIPCRNGYLWGYANRNKQLIIPAKYSKAELFANGLAKVAVGGPNETDRKYGFINTKGEEIIELKYNDVGEFVNNLTWFSMYSDGILKYGVINRKGEILVPATYHSAIIFKNGITKVALYELPRRSSLNDKYGLLDVNGEILVPLKYSFISNFVNNLAVVVIDGKYGIIDEKGNEVIPPMYDGLISYMGFPILDQKSFSEGLIAAKITQNGSSKWGFIDLENKVVAPFKYEIVSNFDDGLATVGEKIANKTAVNYGFINKKGEEIIPPKYDLANKFNEGLSKVILNGNTRFIDKNDKIVLSVEYDYATNFDNGVAIVGNNKQPNTGKYYTLINTKGIEILPMKYDFIENFKDGLARVERNGKFGFIDYAGNLAIPIEYSEASQFENGYAYVGNSEGKASVIDKKGKLLIPFKYNMVHFLAKEQLFHVSIIDVETGMDKEGYIDLDGTEYFED